MTLSPRSETEFRNKVNTQVQRAGDPVERLRLRCLARGIDGIRAIGRSFTRVFDTNRDHKLSYVEFENAVTRYGLTLTRDEMRELVQAFDRDSSGNIDYNEFLERLRPPMSSRRKGLIEMAFNKMDVTGDGVITVEDIKRVYNTRQHPKYLNGEWSERQCLEAYLNRFDGGNKDGVVTKEEFLNYYSAVSASIDQDPYFDLMMRNAFKLQE